MNGPSASPTSTLATIAAASAALAGLTVSPLASQTADADRRSSERAPAAGAGAPLAVPAPAAGPTWKRIVTGAGTLAALLAFDPAIRRDPSVAAGGNGSIPATPGLPGAVADFGNSLGDWQASLPWIAGASVAVGGLTEGLDGVGRVGAMLAGVATGSFATVTIKKGVGRVRPNRGDDALRVEPFSGHISFPSGHAAFAFSVAGGVDAVTEGWVPAAAAYAVASTSAFARVYSGKHWFSDVVVGSAIGALASRAAAGKVLDVLELERASPRPDGPRVELVAVPTFLGVGVRF